MDNWFENKPVVAFEDQRQYINDSDENLYKETEEAKQICRINGIENIKIKQEPLDDADDDNADRCSVIGEEVFTYNDDNIKSEPVDDEETIENIFKEVHKIQSIPKINIVPKRPAQDKLECDNAKKVKDATISDNTENVVQSNMSDNGEKILLMPYRFEYVKEKEPTTVKKSRGRRKKSETSRKTSKAKTTKNTVAPSAATTKVAKKATTNKKSSEISKPESSEKAPLRQSRRKSVCGRKTLTANIIPNEDTKTGEKQTSTEVADVAVNNGEITNLPITAAPVTFDSHELVDLLITLKEKMDSAPVAKPTVKTYSIEEYDAMKQRYDDCAKQLDEVQAELRQMKAEQKLVEKKTEILRPLKVQKMFDLCHLCIAGPFTKSISNNRYLLVFQDEFSKYCIAVAIPSDDPVTVASCFCNNIIYKYSIPKLIITNKSLNFRDSMLTSLCTLLQVRILDIDWKPSKMSVESSAITYITESLEKKRHQHKWDEWIPIMNFMYNTAIHSDTKLTPHNILFGHDLELPKELRNSISINDKDYGDEYVHNTRYLFKESYTNIQQFISKSRN